MSNDRRAVTRLIWAMWGMPIVQLTPIDATPDLLRGPPVGQAERVGFEPTVDRTADNGFRDRPVQPLRHLSEGSATGDREG
jgi:hypothetical protein